MAEQRGLFEKFVASHYSESELCGGAVMFFLTISLGKQCTSYNTPPTSQKRKQSNRVNPRTFQTALIVAPPSYKGFF
jgi:hypothetical protein